MNNILLAVASGLGAAIIGVLLFHGLLKFTDVKDSIIFAFKWLRDNSMQAITGNDGNVSHTRIINIVWCGASLRIVSHCTYNQIPLQTEVLIFMGAAMGFNMVQTFINKKTEANQAVEMAKLNKPVDGDTNV